MIKALKGVAAGESYVDPRLAGGLLRKRRNGGKADIMGLSQRQTEVLQLIAERGLANKQIGVRLGLSEKTVKNHISRIFSKLDISARTQAAVHARSASASSNRLRGRPPGVSLRGKLGIAGGVSRAAHLARAASPGVRMNPTKAASSSPLPRRPALRG